MSLRINLTWLLAVLTPATESKIGNSTKDIKVETDTESPTYSVPVDPTKDSKEEEIFGEVLVPRADYMLGVADLTGEVMRQAVNSAGAGNARMCFQLLQVWSLILCCVCFLFIMSCAPN